MERTEWIGEKHLQRQSSTGKENVCSFEFQSANIFLQLQHEYRERLNIYLESLPPERRFIESKSLKRTGVLNTKVTIQLLKNCEWLKLNARFLGQSSTQEAESWAWGCRSCCWWWFYRWWGGWEPASRNRRTKKIGHTETQIVPADILRYEFAEVQR